MRQLRVRPEAEQDIVDAARWYESQRHGLGEELVATVEAATARLLEHPYAAPSWPLDPAYRKMLLHTFPSALFYQVSDVAVEVAAVAHAKRRPGSWSARSS